MVIVALFCDDAECVREDHNDHCSASVSEDCLVMFSLYPVQFVCIQGVLRSLRCCLPLPW